MNDIYIYSLESEDMTALDEQLLSCVSIERQSRINKYRSPINQKLSLYAELITLMSIKKLTKLSLSDITIVHPEKQKPYLENDTSVDFSYSHTKSCMLHAITNCGRVGADIERHKDIDSVPYVVMRKVFHDEEIAYVEIADSPLTKRSRFYEIWTKKEAYTKCFGTGLCTDVKHINCLNDDIANHFHSWEYDCYTCSVYFEEIQEASVSYLSLEQIASIFDHTIRLHK